MREIDLVEKKHLKKEVPTFKVGDIVRVSLKVKEGDKTRSQIFEGTVIRRRGRGINQTFTVLRETQSDTIEKIFFIHSPIVEGVHVVKSGKSKKAKLYHLRKKK